jgi:hypothetical protein
MPENDSAAPAEPSVSDVREWVPDATIGEVVEFASKWFPTHLLLWVARMREKEYQNAYQECRQMHRVVSRIEAYLRMVQRRGPKPEKKPDETDS